MITEILKEFSKKGYKAYIVGGYPRDLYLNKKTNDLDICTNCTKIEEVFPNNYYNKYGSTKIKYKNILFEVTCFRKEEYKNNRFPKIKYINSLKKDLKRRDFTINTLCIDEFGNLIDLLNAKKDINKKIIKTVGNSDKKIKEDSLRILRAIRFAITLDFKLDKKLEKSIIKYASSLNKLSNKRKTEELNKIFTNSNNEKAINLIKKLGLDSYLELNNYKNKYNK